jgi:hypothetical protein
MSAEITFWDGSKRRNWFMARAIARKVLTQPDMLVEIAEAAERAWAGDPSKVRSLTIWRGLTKLSPEAFTAALLRATPEAEEARESFPPYLALTPAERADYIEAARRERAEA